MSLPAQVIVWSDHTYKHSEARSVGDCLGFFDGGPRTHVLVRAPREEDPVYAVCCTDFRCVRAAGAIALKNKPVVLAVFETADPAWDWAQRHAQAHDDARLPFGERQALAYRRQGRLERALCG